MMRSEWESGPNKSSASFTVPAVAVPKDIYAEGKSLSAMLLPGLMNKIDS